MSKPPHRSVRAFSLVELLTVLAIGALLASLAGSAIGNLSSSGKLSHSGNKVAGLLELCRSIAMARNSMTALVVSTDPASGAAYRAVTIMELKPRQDGGALAPADWRQVNRWEILPDGIFIDSAAPALTFNRESDGAGTPGVPQPSFPALAQGKDTVRHYRYLVFLPNGSLLCGKPESLRLAEGFAPPGEPPVYTRPSGSGPANYYQLTVLGSTGRTLISRP